MDYQQRRDVGLREMIMEQEVYSIPVAPGYTPVEAVEAPVIDSESVKAIPHAFTRLMAKSSQNASESVSEGILSFEDDVAVAEATLPASIPSVHDIVNGVNIRDLAAQFDDEEEDYEPEWEPQNTEASPQQKLREAQALKAQALKEMSNGIYLSPEQLTEVVNRFMDSLLTPYPMKAIDAVAEVYPERAEMLCKRSNDTQAGLLRAELNRASEHVVARSIIESPMLGKAAYNGIAKKSIGATLNNLHMFHNIATQFNLMNTRISALEAAVGVHSTANTVNTNRSLSAEVIEGIQNATGSIRTIAKQFGVSTGVVSKYRTKK